MVVDTLTKGRNSVGLFNRKGGGIDRRDRCQGALLGVHAGDSLGATTEFMSPDDVRVQHGRLKNIVGGGVFQWSAGDATDDTDLTKAVLDAYQDDAGSSVSGNAGRRMVEWMRKGPRDIGGTTAKALSDFDDTGNTWGGRSDESSAANGSLMRCAPTGLVRADDPESRRAESREISSITHAEPRAVDSCVAYNEIVAGLVNGKSARQAVDGALDACDEEGLDPRVRSAIEFGRRLDLDQSVRSGGWVADSGPLTYYDASTLNDDWHEGRGYVLDSLSIAVAAVEDPRGAENVLSDIASMGGDSDTNAAIAGGLVGARDGASGLPSAWVEQLQFRDEFTEAGAQIADGTFGVDDLGAVAVATSDERAVPDTERWGRQAHTRTDPRTGRSVRVRAHEVRRR